MAIKWLNLMVLPTQNWQDNKGAAEEFYSYSKIKLQENKRSNYCDVWIVKINDVWKYSLDIKMVGK
jgi:hypothetical protein